MSLDKIQNHPWILTHTTIRPTITQKVVREGLPCTYDPVSEETTETGAENLIKPFEEDEYLVLSKAEREESKELDLKFNLVSKVYT